MSQLTKFNRKKNYFFYSYLLLFTNCFANNLNLQKNCAVTYELSGGRLGDNLLAYCHAKWISYKYSIPILYKPFEYSDKLVLDEKEPLKYNNDIYYRYNQIIEVNSLDNVKFENAQDTLFIVPFFPECATELDLPVYCGKKFFKVDWDDKNFKQIIKENISSKIELQPVSFNQKRINVAVHLRIGSYQDTQSLYFLLPTKFPPFTFYVEQMQKIINKFPNEQILFHLFTDSGNPQLLVDKIKSALKNEQISFMFRKNNSWSNNVLEDFFALSQFKYIIRPASNFSIIACKLGNCEIEIYPSSYSSTNNKIIIAESNVITKYHDAES